MTRGDKRPSIDMMLSHLEIYVRDLGRMEDFYSRCLGFVVTDRGEGPDALVFLSRNPHEHHQLVLNPRRAELPPADRIDHVSFRVASLADIRALHAALANHPETPVEAVSHGTTWSLYFRDPDGNRLEVFADTPWYVSQPCRFPIDLALDDDALHAFTEAKIRALPGFKPAQDWMASHRSAVGASGVKAAS